MPPTSFDSWTWRCGTALANLMARLGVGPMARLTTTGRITGRAHTVPVVPIDHAGARWLVAPYGPVAWVHNALADPTVTLRRGRSTTAATPLARSGRTTPGRSCSVTSRSPPGPQQLHRQRGRTRRGVHRRGRPPSGVRVARRRRPTRQHSGGER